MKQQEYSKVAAMGTTLTPEVFRDTQAMFAGQAPKPDPATCRIARDIAYGADDRHRLDVFAPTGGEANKPVLLFVHGGGFVRGDKGGPDDAFYNNVGAWAVANGLVAVTMTYRLAPASAWPAGAEDVDAALAWLKANVSEHGGDPHRIVLMGQSAGAVHVANYLAGHHGAMDRTLPAAAVMVSGLYDMTRLKYSAFEDAYFGTDPERAGTQSSLEALVGAPIPLLFAVAEHDPDNFQQQAKFVTDAVWGSRGRLPRMLYLSGHNHLSPVYRLGLEGDDLGPQLLAFIANQTGGAPGGAVDA